VSSDFPTLDFRDFHERELPRRLAAGNAAAAARDDLPRIGALAFRLPGGEAYTYLPVAGGVEVVAGDERARTVIEISRELWQDVVHELETAPGLLYAGKVKCLRGNAMRFVRWEPALRAMFHGRPIFDPTRTDLRDLDGRPLDPEQTFTLDSPDAPMAHFLRTAGFLLVKGVFDADEVAGLRAAADRARALARPGDRKSWWGRNRSGESVLCRVTHAARIPELRRLPDDPRLARLGALSRGGLVSRANGAEDGVTLLIKNPDMVEGLSDIPWHRDCGMGGHASMCPVLIASIFLQPSRPETGELVVLPGSHEASYGFADPRDPAAPRGVSLAADPGDVSLHYGDVMHAAPPPTGEGPYRQCLLLAFVRPDAYNHRGERSYNDVLLGRDDGQVEHLEKVAGRS
jgi:ectoine hydroxylase-related dioxygenase (phytanoyl-CoA dioxygenase family)